MAVMDALTSAVGSRDLATYEHCIRVASLAVNIAQEMGISGPQIRELHKAALLHDIGKIGIPDATLQKSTPLDEDDWDTIREHPETGVRMLHAAHFPGEFVLGIKHHHERFDGTGYPSQLSGRFIPLIARILAVADSFDALTSDRPYRDAHTIAESLEEIRRCSGSQFDPIVVRALARIVAASNGQVHSGDASAA